MIVLSADDANTLFTSACRAITNFGEPVSPRGLATTEILGAHLRLTRPRRRFVDMPPLRRLNPAFAVAEALWILSGSDEDWIFQYNQALTRYADDGVLQGAYGPRMRRWNGIDQLDRTRQLLQRDPDTRQAVIQLYDPQRDTRGHRDVPCTLSYRFYLRRGRLHMHTTMRSQDVWLGFPYDIFTNTLIQELLAGWLGAQLGEYHHHIDSLHLYAEHFGAAEQLAHDPDPSPLMPQVAIPWTRADRVVRNTITEPRAPGATGAWSAFADMLASYRAWSSGQRERARTLLAATDGDLARALERWYDHRAPVAADQGAHAS
ncbi:thymidylate synthase [Nocardia sp. CNY236]|uniref:thymidylate synthase n=1 Tax=Nocardia sp. CNY236 TaxID=1169152 RepID=UPI00041A8801|nr:thymidylate synthase [Nocardia sp. CNY236]